jgi:hypothetical protein
MIHHTIKETHKTQSVIITKHSVNIVIDEFKIQVETKIDKRMETSRHR